MKPLMYRDIAVFDCLSPHHEIGDLVTCTGCGKTMLVDLASEQCPLCGGDGCLSWVDGMPQEICYSDLEVYK